MKKCARCPNEAETLLVAPDSPSNEQIAVCVDCYKKAFKKAYPGEPVPDL